MSRLRVASEVDVEKVTTQTKAERAKAIQNAALAVALLEVVVLETLGIAALIKVLRS